nr:MAG TPA: hypothetical protein [Caudoviricetes sp.]
MKKKSKINERGEIPSLFFFILIYSFHRKE